MRKAFSPELSPGCVNLGLVASRLLMLAVSCNRCGRRGRLCTDRLLARRGSDLPISTLLRAVVADCPRMIAGQVHDGCEMHFAGWSGDVADQNGTPAPPGALYTSTVDHAERPVAVHQCSGGPTQGVVDAQW
jgi:hypothetical protein